MKRILFCICLALGLFAVTGTVGIANASLTTIGTATYGGSDYNLIYDDDAPMGPIVWLDFTFDPPWQRWWEVNPWATNLNSQITAYQIDPHYNVTWIGGWRLPDTQEVNDGSTEGYDGTTTRGYNIVTSELGHLFYEELGNVGEYDTNGNPLTGYGLQNTEPFQNLRSGVYWSETEWSAYQGYHWAFNTQDGHQFPNVDQNSGYGLAVRNANISAVPIPGAIWLLGSGLLG